MSTESYDNERTKQVEHLVLAYQVRIRAYLLSRTGNKDVTYDLAQETFLVALKRIDSFDTTRPAWPWLVGIAHNLLYGYWRKQKRDFNSDALGAFIAIHQLKTDEKIADLDYMDSRVMALRQCLEDLPANGRKLIQMIYEENLKCTEVAKRLNSKAGSIRTAVHRIRVGLVGCIKTRLKQELT